MDNQYCETLEQSKVNNLSDALACESDILVNWEDVRNKILTSEERAASALRVGIMLELTQARNEKGLSQRKLEEISGVRQPVIARMENGTNSPQLDTVLRVLGALGKTLAIVPLEPAL